MKIEIAKILTLLENSLYKESFQSENVITLDTSKKRTNKKGQIVYGGGSDYELSYNASERHFSCYVHALTNQPGQTIKIKNKQSGASMTFTLVKIDKDGSDEDIYGWNYECNSPKGKLTLLIIND